MNRAQRRQAAKNNGVNFRKAAHATDEDIERRIRQINDETHAAAQNHFMGLMYCVFILVLRKLLKFGPVRTLRVLHEVAAIINDLHEGTITVFDIKKEAEDLGVKVVFDTNYNIIEAGIFEEEKYGYARKKIEAERMNMYKSFEREGERIWTHPDWSDEYVTH